MKLKLRYTKLPLSKAQFGYDIPGIPKKLSVPNLNIPGITPPQFVIPQGPQNFDLVNPGNISPGQEMNLNPVSGPNSFAWSNPFQAEAPSIRLNTVKRDGTTVTTGQKGNPEYTVYEQADYSQPVKQATETDLSGMQKLQKFGNKVGGLTDILSMVSTGVDYLNQRKKAKQFDRDFRRQQFDITGIANPEFEGNYDINTGMFQPYRMFNPNEGAAMAEHGGQINNTMKIRITGTPMENMAYGGQSGYGLDLGRKQVYADMPKSRSESVSSSIGAVPREIANIEAEGGETVYGDLDGDGGMEHMKIRGKRHTEGGVPLNVPEGSFIFSDTAKMRIKDPDILSYFGLSAKNKGYTPAEIAKRYDINKYKVVLDDPNADEFDKATAQHMIRNYEEKLAKLALVQEGMKGFPGGVPKVAEDAVPQARMGGHLPKYQGAQGPSTVSATATADPAGTNPKKPRTVTKSELERLQKEGYTLVPGTTNQYIKKGSSERFEYKPEIPGGPGDRKVTVQKRDNVDPSQYGTDPCATVRALAAKGNTEQDIKNARVVLPSRFEEFRNCFEEGKAKFTPATDPTCPEGYEKDPDNPGQCRRKITDQTEDVVTFTEDVVPNKIPGGGGDNPGEKFKFLQPDKFNMAAAAMFGPRVYFPYSPDMRFRPNRLALQDWQAQAQAIQSGVNTAGNQLATYQPGQALASNMSFLQGQAADQIGKTIAATDAGNVDRFNAFTQREGDRKDLVDQFNQQNRVSLYDKGVIAKQQFDNAQRQYVNNLAKSYTNAWNNRMNLGLLNTTNPIYKIDPDTGRSYFTKGYGSDYFANAASGSNQSGLTDWGAMFNEFQEAQKKFPGLTKEEYLKMSRPSFTQTDSDGDGVADRSTVRRRKRGGQVNPLIEFLMGGYSFDPRGY